MTTAVMTYAGIPLRSLLTLLGLRPYQALRRQKVLASQEKFLKLFQVNLQPLWVHLEIPRSGDAHM